jgi:hypothetical protein
MFSSPLLSKQFGSKLKAYQEFAKKDHSEPLDDIPLKAW